jgi:hypothetical protein
MHIHSFSTKKIRSTWYIFLNYPFSVLPGRKKPNFSEQIVEQTASRTAKPYAGKFASFLADFERVLN